MIEAGFEVTVGNDQLWVGRSDDGETWVSVRRVCIALGLNPDNQRVKLQEKAWARTSVQQVRDSRGRTQDAFVVALKCLPMWLATIDIGRVSGFSAPKLLHFQQCAHDVLAAAFVDDTGPRTVISTAHPSGGRVGSGGAVVAAPLAPRPVDDLAVVDALAALAAAIRLDRAEVAAVRADLVLERDARAALQMQVQQAQAVAESAAIVADRASRAGMQFRESRRRIDAAVGHCTRTIKRWCAETSTPWQAIYSAVRSDLGLRRTMDGGPALGRAKLRADQVLRLARCATNLGVTGLGVSVIEGILNGHDDDSRPGFIDVDTAKLPSRNAGSP